MQSKSLGEALHQERGGGSGPLRFCQQQAHQTLGGLIRHAQARNEGRAVRVCAVNVLGDGVEQVRLEIQQRHVWPTSQGAADRQARWCDRNLSRPRPLAIDPAVFSGLLDKHWPRQVGHQKRVSQARDVDGTRWMMVALKDHALPFGPQAR